MPLINMTMTCCSVRCRCPSIAGLRPLGHWRMSRRSAPGGWKQAKGRADWAEGRRIIKKCVESKLKSREGGRGEPHQSAMGRNH